MHTFIALILSGLFLAPFTPAQLNIPQDEKIYDILEYNIPEPELVKRVEPIYPDIARKKKQNGYVILELVVDKEGYVSEVQVVRLMSADFSRKLKQRIGINADLKALVAIAPPDVKDIFEFGKAASEAAIQWQFEPCRYNGKAVPVRLLTEVEFNLVY